MTEAGLAHFADALVFVHGPRAMCEAARHAELCERTGDFETADRWRRTMTLVRASQAKPTPKLLCAA